MFGEDQEPKTAVLNPCSNLTKNNHTKMMLIMVLKDIALK
ncbi:hypothetical protein CLV98_102437 [Dyadobacter jejuensis]|uniref:Uncharacterized protein n=1 Tax=Dyadobacter jejuensis TaxID=1082580 RepID=A0A316APG8_9BACT|nr:hypothetical protein CLV98_102437 [Dyadobacter jejuensis]